MWIAAALAFLPIAAVVFGPLAGLILVFPEATRDFAGGATLLYGAAALSFVIAAPLSWMAAKRMTTRRERRMAGL